MISENIGQGKLRIKLEPSSFASRVLITYISSISYYSSPKYTVVNDQKSNFRLKTMYSGPPTQKMKELRLDSRNVYSHLSRIKRFVK